jgi:hypothetical protein
MGLAGTVATPSVEGGGEERAIPTVELSTATGKGGELVAEFDTAPFPPVSRRVMTSPGSSSGLILSPEMQTARIAAILPFDPERECPPDDIVRAWDVPERVCWVCVPSLDVIVPTVGATS